ncbi:MAG: antibiotic biosynthesis monooxygenase [Chloroflexota bacterium]|nr:antibiotic biosynthesis monooxygenase [Chloroflexota bacterium]
MAAPYLFMVRANVAPEHEEAFNAWYDGEHVHDVSRLPGCIRGTRYRVVDGLAGDTGYRYLALYEFESEAALRAAVESEYFAQLISRFDQSFGAHTQRTRSFYGQISPPPAAAPSQT